jgi:sugar lactone lactonase YvrE
MTALQHFFCPAAMRSCAFLVLTLVAPAAQTQTVPSINQQPASQTIRSGTDVTLSVGVSGTGPFTYQWRFNGTNLPNGIVTTVAGGGNFGHAGDGGPATSASLNFPSGVAVDASGNLYVADANNNRVRKVDQNGVITTVAGNGNPADYGDGGAATNAFLHSPSGVAVDASGNLFIADTFNARVRKVDGNGIITTVVAFSRLETYSVAVDASGGLFIADYFNNRVWKSDAIGSVTAFAGDGYINPGNGWGRYSGDGGAATNASLSGPTGVAVDASGNVFIADTYNFRVRMVDESGIIDTVAGDGHIGQSGDSGAATNAKVDLAFGVALDGDGNLFIADRDDNRIRRVGADGIITTVAGNGAGGYSGDGGAAVDASLFRPWAVAVDSSGNLFIADTGNDVVREVHFAGLPTLSLDDVSLATVGEYQVVITSPYGSVTSAVATLTVIVPPVIDMSPPLVAGGNLLLGFRLSQGSSPSFTLLQAPFITGPWTTNTGALLATNTQSGGYQFMLPVPASTQFLQVRSP